MQDTLTPPLDQVMKNTAPHLFLFTIALLLATSIIQVIQTLLMKRAQAIFPLLRMQIGQLYSTLITSARSMDVLVCPHCKSWFITPSARAMHSYTTSGYLPMEIFRRCHATQEPQSTPAGDPPQQLATVARRMDFNTSLQVHRRSLPQNSRTCEC